MNFTQLKDLPINIIIVGILIILIKWLMGKIDEKDKKIENLIQDFLGTLNKFEKLDTKVDTIDKKMDCLSEEMRRNR